MRLDPEVVTSQSPYLRAVTGFFCPLAHIAYITSGRHSTEHESTFIHEAYHYQQMVTTPFGLHLALVMWDIALELMEMVKTIAQKSEYSVQIPLMLSALERSPLSPRIKQIITVATVIRKEYSSWLFDDAPNLNKGEPDVLKTFSGLCLHRAERCLAFIGGPETKLPDIPRFPSYPYLPTYNGNLISAKEVLENAATVASLPMSTITVDALTTVGGLLETLRQNKPSRYIRLLESTADLCPKAESAVGFINGFLALCDLALFGPLLPGMESYRAEEQHWENIHPAWRFFKLLKSLEDNKDLSIRLFATQTGIHKPVCDQLCRILNWPVWSRTIKQFRITHDGKSPLGWIVSEFNRAMKLRQANHNVIYSVPLKYLMLTLTAIEKSTTKSDEDIDRLREIFFNREVKERFFIPPVVIIGDNVNYSAHATTEMIDSARVWYHILNFADRLLFHDNLNYPIALLPDDQIRKGFEMFFGVSPDQISRHPMVI